MFDGVTRMTFYSNRGWVNSLFELPALWKTWVLLLLSNKLIRWLSGGLQCPWGNRGSKTAVCPAQLQNARLVFFIWISGIPARLYFNQSDGYHSFGEGHIISSSWCKVKSSGLHNGLWRPERRGEAFMSLMSVLTVNITNKELLPCQNRTG